MDKMDGVSKDLTVTNIEKIKELFPNVVTEGKIDFEMLRTVLGDDVEETKEKYQFTWNGKAESIKLAQTPSSATLRPCKEKSKNWDDTENLYIEGDNLEVLKQLQKTYFGKIKMIYIDPPYNTGSDFVYKDDFKDSIENYKEQTNQTQKSNPETSGRYHSDWLNMMYPRLILARNLLMDDGAIFISIDDNEAANLIKICDEVFGDINRIALICHKSRASISNDKIISPNHNIVLFYAKNIATLEAKRKMIGLDPDLDGFNFDDNDGRGAYRLVPVDGPGGAKKGNPYYEFMGIEGYWRFSKETMQQKYNEGLVVKKENSLSQKYYKSTAENTRRTATTWWDDAGLISTATSRLKQLMGETTFDTPKPLDLIDRMLRMITFDDNNAIILDFFAGSSTTAHAVMEFNAENEGQRKFIMVQLPEIINEKTDAYKSGYRTICEIGEKRIIKAGERIKEEWNEQRQGGLTPYEEFSTDIGFKVFKLDSTNINPWDNTNEYDEVSLFDVATVFKLDRSNEDVLYEIMLKYGVFDQTASKVVINSKTMYRVGHRHMIVCLEDKIDDSDIAEICKLEPRVVVFKEDGFKDDNAKINAEYNLKKSGAEDVKCI